MGNCQLTQVGGEGGCVMCMVGPCLDHVRDALAAVGPVVKSVNATVKPPPNASPDGAVISPIQYAALLAGLGYIAAVELPPPQLAYLTSFAFSLREVPARMISVLVYVPLPFLLEEVTSLQGTTCTLFHFLKSWKFDPFDSRTGRKTYGSINHGDLDSLKARIVKNLGTSFEGRNIALSLFQLLERTLCLSEKVSEVFMSPHFKYFHAIVNATEPRRAVAKLLQVAKKSKTLACDMHSLLAYRSAAQPEDAVVCQRCETRASGGDFGLVLNSTSCCMWSELLSSNNKTSPSPPLPLPTDIKTWFSSSACCSSASSSSSSSSSSPYSSSSSFPTSSSSSSSSSSPYSSSSSPYSSSSSFPASSNPRFAPTPPPPPPPPPPFLSPIIGVRVVLLFVASSENSNNDAVLRAAAVVLQVDSQVLSNNNNKANIDVESKKKSPSSSISSSDASGKTNESILRAIKPLRSAVVVASSVWKDFIGKVVNADDVDISLAGENVESCVSSFLNDSSLSLLVVCAAADSSSSSPREKKSESNKKGPRSMSPAMSPRRKILGGSTPSVGDRCFVVTVIVDSVPQRVSIKGPGAGLISENDDLQNSLQNFDPSHVGDVAPTVLSLLHSRVCATASFNEMAN